MTKLEDLKAAYEAAYEAYEAYEAANDAAYYAYEAYAARDDPNEQMIGEEE